MPAGVDSIGSSAPGVWPAGATRIEVASDTVVDQVNTAEDEVTVSTEAPKICCGTSGISKPVS